ncbi:MAG: hypothetical protein ACRD1L_08780 [Terriglobales bacterium]
MRLAKIAGILALSAGLALGQGAAPGSATQQAAVSGAFPSGLRVSAELKTKLDTKSTEAGSAVTAVTTENLKDHGNTLLPKGSMLSGRVTGVQAAESKKSPSRLGVIFNRATTKKGEAIALRAAIVALVPSYNPAGDMSAEAMPTPSPGGRGGGMGAGGGMDSGDMGTVAARANGGAAAGGLPSGIGSEAGGLTPRIVTAANGEIESVGRVGNGDAVSIVVPAPIPGQPNQIGSVLATPKGDLKLDAGTRVVVQILQ